MTTHSFGSSKRCTRRILSYNRNSTSGIWPIMPNDHSKKSLSKKRTRVKKKVIKPRKPCRRIILVKWVTKRTVWHQIKNEQSRLPSKLRITWKWLWVRCLKSRIVAAAQSMMSSTCVGPRSKSKSGTISWWRSGPRLQKRSMTIFTTKEARCSHGWGRSSTSRLSISQWLMSVDWTS